MQTSAYVFPVVLAILLVAAIFFLTRAKKYADVRIGNATMHAEIADNLVKQMAGLMGRASLADDEGMLFPLLHESRPDFWMMGMRIPIDVVYLGSNKTVVDMKSDLQPFSLSNPSTNFAPSQKAMYVLEISAGFVKRHDIKVGAKADFTLG